MGIIRKMLSMEYERQKPTPSLGLRDGPRARSMARTMGHVEHLLSFTPLTISLVSITTKTPEGKQGSTHLGTVHC